MADIIERVDSNTCKTREVRLHELLYSNDDRQELAEYIMALEDELMALVKDAYVSEPQNKLAADNVTGCIRECDERIAFCNRITAAINHACVGLDIKTSADDIIALHRLRQMVMRGETSFTPSEFGWPLRWGSWYAEHMIERIRHISTKQQVIISDGMQFTVTRYLVNIQSGEDGDGRVTYYIDLD